MSQAAPNSRATETAETEPPVSQLRRCRQQVVVRAGTAPSTLESHDDRRHPMPTLIGLAPRATADTEPDLFVERATLPGGAPAESGSWDETPEPPSGVRVRIPATSDLPATPEPNNSGADGEVPPEADQGGHVEGPEAKLTPLPGSPTSLRRPEFLLDDVDAERARRYRAIADQLIACGIFEPTG